MLPLLASFAVAVVAYGQYGEVYEAIDVVFLGFGAVEEAGGGEGHLVWLMVLQPLNHLKTTRLRRILLIYLLEHPLESTTNRLLICKQRPLIHLLVLEGRLDYLDFRVVVVLLLVVDWWLHALFV